MTEITYRIAEEEDRLPIIALLNSVFSGQQRSERVRDLTSWEWKNRGNVFDDTLNIVADHEGEIIGTGTLWPFRFIWEGREHLAYQTCGLAVSENFRRRGVFRNINRVRIETAKENGASFLFSFPNSKSLPGYKKMGWAIPGKLKWYVKPLKPVQIFKDVVFENEPSVPFPLDESLALKENRISYSRISERNGKLCLKKNNEYFDWRYANHPYFKYGFNPYDDNDEFTWGAVFSVLQKGRYKEMVIIDLLTKNFEMTQSILKKVEEIAQKEGVMYLAMVAPDGSSPVNMAMRGYIPYRMKNLAVYPLDLSIRNTVTEMGNWSLFAGLHDSI